MRVHKKASQVVQQAARRRTQVQKNIVAIVALVAVMMMFWISAVPLLNRLERTSLSEELRNARAVWEAQNISHYQFDFSINCLCDGFTPEPVTIRVSEASNNNTERRMTGESENESGAAAIPSTIAGAFAIVADLLEQQPAELEIRYDTEFAYPAEVRADFDKNTRGDEVGYYLSNFRILGNSNSLE